MRSISKDITIIGFAIICIISISYNIRKGYKTDDKIQILQDSIERLNKPLYDTLFVTISTYQNTPEQCNKDNWRTSDGNKIEKGDTSIIAVSRDILFNTDLHFGDTVQVRYILNGKSIVTKKVIRDIMNYRFTNSIDILTWDKRNFKTVGEIIWRR
jgi:hypothetical protein